MDRDDIDSRAEEVVQQLMADIESAGEDEDPRETIRRVNEIPDPRVRGRVMDLLRERRRSD